eukprot:TRINITY_DN18432_c0_g1_i2.p1 TRINITY_DN18432_c0_g1~~TRINITY_DN18432_c0_g1_i2.p1  ORF type:complete len:159 (-),score=37.85 TRINITY_DN18432_c0_g1_i2:188-664(-)
MWQCVCFLILMVAFHVESHMSAGQGKNGQYQNPIPGSAPRARSPPLKRHQNIHVNMAEEREHIKSHIKDEYINTESLDDNSLLMQYFRKHDTDDNLKLDGLELLKALARMDEDDHHNDEDDGGHPGSDGDVMPVFDIKEIIPIVDTILREDDKVVGKP